MLELLAILRGAGEANSAAAGTLVKNIGPLAEAHYHATHFPAWEAMGRLRAYGGGSDRAGGSREPPFWAYNLAKTGDAVMINGRQAFRLHNGSSPRALGCSRTGLK